MPRIFNKANVILVRVDEEDLNSFVVDMDIEEKLAEKELVEPPSYSNTYKLYPNEVPFLIKIN